MEYSLCQSRIKYSLCQSRILQKNKEKTILLSRICFWGSLWNVLFNSPEFQKKERRTTNSLEALLLRLALGSSLCQSRTLKRKKTSPGMFSLSVVNLGQFVLKPHLKSHLFPCLFAADLCVESPTLRGDFFFDLFFVAAKAKTMGTLISSLGLERFLSAQDIQVQRIVFIFFPTVICCACKKTIAQK